jgi:hypothetical protein
LKGQECRCTDTKIQALKVSPGYANLQTNYLKFLDDLRNAADNYVKGTSALQAGDQGKWQ